MFMPAIAPSLDSAHSREEFRGEVGTIIAVKPELGGESCNCGLQTAAETDNHLVLVTSTTIDRFTMTGNAATQKTQFHSRELESTTAEFTPRVRLQHAHFTHEFVQPFIDGSPDKALLVRVSGQRLFHSEHFLHNGLVRVNDWEIHPQDLHVRDLHEWQHARNDVQGRIGCGLERHRLDELTHFVGAG